jgi:hypothetical protein
MVRQQPAGEPPPAVQPAAGRSSLAAARVTERPSRAAARSAVRPRQGAAPTAGFHSAEARRSRWRETSRPRFRDRVPVGQSSCPLFAAAFGQRRHAHATTRKISSTDVKPINAFCQPSSRNVRMPCERATRAISVLDARATANRSISSVTAITSWRAMRPR